ncbi:hypothetical protein [Maribacter aestuarii]|uniref:hypothetical protein n=1 Tax=Maribacter aestuarii TaxID=1130723 RepID=UPI0025A50CDD|nr:hypothetical protein [Maribacter aestuarii]
MVDGKASNAKKVKEMAPETIESINILKGESAIKKYGKKAKDGVIEITTKKIEIALFFSKTLRPTLKLESVFLFQI